jgi:phosphoribosyl 1,2-cyclic phosphodiesterase
VGETLDGLKGIFITHEHSDHVRGIGTLARKMDVPVYVTPPTFEGLPEAVGKLPRVVLFDSGERIGIDGLTLTSYGISHDAVDPVSFVVEFGSVKLGVASDLGHVTRLVQTRLAGSHGLVLESNYCPDLLQRGSYPPALKQRIRGTQGHLSNQDMTSLLAGLMHERLQVVVLVHLSQENNLPDLARAMAERTLAGHGAALHVAHQDSPTPLFEIHE